MLNSIEEQILKRGHIWYMRKERLVKKSVAKGNGIMKKKFSIYLQRN